MKKALSKSKAGFTLIELMIVVAIIGILAALAIPAFIGFVRRSKTVEATSNIGTLFRGLSAYYQDEHWTRMTLLMAGGSAGAATACSVGSATTPNVPSDQRSVIDWDVGAGAQVWRDAQFTIADPVYYQFEIVDQGGAGMCGWAMDTYIYDLRAHGDLDMDGTQSLFELSVGSDAQNQLGRMPGFYIENQLE